MLQKTWAYLPIFAAAVLGVGSLPSVSAHANDLTTLFAQADDQPEFLPVEKAFAIKPTQMGDELVVKFTVTPKHYIYQNRLSLKLPDGITAEPWTFDKQANLIDDPTFGSVPVFEENVVARTRLTSTSQMSNQPITIRWQGCAKAGLCYPPQNTVLKVNLATHAKTSDTKNLAKTGETTANPKADDKAGNKTSNAKTADKSDKSDKNDKTAAQSAQQKTDADKSASDAKTADKADDKNSNLAAQDAAADTAQNTTADNADDQNPLEQPNYGEKTAQDNAALASASDEAAADDAADDGKYTLNHSLPTVEKETTTPILFIGLLLLAGLLLSFTPCVYPMIPIVANIVAKQHAKANAKRGFMLSLAYGVGVSSAYGILGALTAWFGQALGIATWLQRAEVLIVVAALFVIFALVMFGWLQLRLPSAISDKLSAKSQAADKWLGTLAGSYLSGLLSALVVSPCVSAPMAGALTFVATSNNVLFGFAALFAFGLGLSVPLMIIGTMQGKWMPKSGAWMQHIRTLGGFLLLGVALLLIERVLLNSAMLALWAVWFVALAAWLFVAVGRHTRIFRALAIIPMAWAIVLLYGVSLGSADAWHPWQKPTASQIAQPDIHAETLAQLDAVLASHDKVLVDVTADWCIECRIMERTLFTNRPEQLAEYQVVKLDISETNENSQAILARYQLFGPPALLIYHQGQLTQVLLGETKLDAFKAALSK
ncbi:protein-disulfide reductase DsbD family protein [Moraxella marmotae]|uniref:protein-disulfide reductase DsbD family protein n=1 Tax=Moraxella marmotae TaxID=3344520 RepID=UPI0035F2690E